MNGNLLESLHAQDYIVFLPSHTPLMVLYSQRTKSHVLVPTSTDNLVLLTTSASEQRAGWCLVLC